MINTIMEYHPYEDMKKFKASYVANHLSTFDSEELANIILSVVKLRPKSDLLKGVEGDLTRNLKAHADKKQDPNPDQQEMF